MAWLALAPLAVIAAEMTITVPPGAVWLAYQGYDACSTGGGSVDYNYNGVAGVIAVTPGQEITIEVDDNAAAAWQLQGSSGNNLEAGNLYGDLNNPAPCGE